MRIENRILSSILSNEQYTRKVLPFLEVGYFSEKSEAIVIDEVQKFFANYNKVPSAEILLIELANRKDINDTELKQTVEVIEALSSEDVNEEWLIEKTEKFCQDKALYNAVLRSISIIEGNDKEFSTDALPSLLSQALAVSFDTNLGHDYFEDIERRYDFYHRVEDKIAFDLDLFNKITKGGSTKKTLNVVLSQTGGGKSIWLCHTAAQTLMQGKNVVYFTMEMAEERIAERIDANLMNAYLNDIPNMSKDTYMSRMQKVAGKSTGKLIIKEYAPGSAHVGHFRAFLQELKFKKGFTPDLICVDYLNICASSRLKMGNVNSYAYIKAIAEEMRALSFEYDVPLWSASQVNRGGTNNSDVELTDTSESMGLPHTCDLLFALMPLEELADLNQVLIKQLKNRYNDLNYYRKFVIGLDKAKMQFYNVEESAQKNLDGVGNTDNEPEYDIPLFDKSKQSDDKFSQFKF